MRFSHGDAVTRRNTTPEIVADMIAFLINPKACMLRKLGKTDVIFPRRGGAAERCRYKDSGKEAKRWTRQLSTPDAATYSFFTDTATRRDIRLARPLAHFSRSTSQTVLVDSLLWAISPTAETIARGL